jgi:hypothetical protein
MKRKRWTQAETAEFVQLYPTTMAKDLAERFGCSVAQIYHKQQNTGVNKSTDFLHQYYKANFIGYRSTRDGYMVEKTANGFKMVHVLMWEAINGPVPKGMFVVFKDRNKQNICIENLELIDRHEHMRRNNIKNLPEELREVLHIKKSITRQINKLEKNGTQQN